MRLPQAAQVQAVIASDPLSSTTVRTGPATRSACPWRQFARLDVAAVAMETNRQFFMDDMGRSSHRIEMKTASCSDISRRKHVPFQRCGTRDLQRDCLQDGELRSEERGCRRQ